MPGGELPLDGNLREGGGKTGGRTPGGGKRGGGRSGGPTHECTPGGGLLASL